MAERAWVAALAAVALAGCSDPGATLESGFTAETRVYVDVKTGCEYLIWDGYNAGTMIPRMGADGKQICGAAQ